MEKQPLAHNELHALEDREVYIQDVLRWKKPDEWDENDYKYIGGWDYLPNDIIEALERYSG